MFQPVCLYYPIIIIIIIILSLLLLLLLLTGRWQGQGSEVGRTTHLTTDVEPGSQKEVEQTDEGLYKKGKGRGNEMKLPDVLFSLFISYPVHNPGTHLIGQQTCCFLPWWVTTITNRRVNSLFVLLCSDNQEINTDCLSQHGKTYCHTLLTAACESKVRLLNQCQFLEALFMLNECPLY